VIIFRSVKQKGLTIPAAIARPQTVPLHAQCGILRIGARNPKGDERHDAADPGAEKFYGQGEGEQ